MRHAKLWPALALLALAGWTPLTPLAAGEPTPDRAALGVTMCSASDGVSIVGIVPGSPAEQSGLRAGDVVRFVDDQRVQTVRQLTDAIRRHAPGSAIDLTVRRAGQRRVMSATLATELATFGNRPDGNRVMTAGDAAPATDVAAQNRAAINNLRQELRRAMSIEAGLEAAQQQPDWDWNATRNGGHDPSILQ